MTRTIVDWIAQHGIPAVFALMAVDALLPVGGELIMLYAGVIAAGALGYMELAAAGTLGYLAGSLAGWTIGVRGGRGFVERHGRWLHLSPAAFEKAERWFARHGGRAVFLGRITPLVRSFISVPAGVFRSPLAPYTLLTALGSAIWCFGFAAVGYAAKDSWESIHHALRYADYAVVAALLVLVAIKVRAAAAAARSRQAPRS
jgi:membrane protein DedA with SNARE-associated domain